MHLCMQTISSSSSDRLLRILVVAGIFDLFQGT
jgi:hypothetical protein